MSEKTGWQIADEISRSAAMVAGIGGDHAPLWGLLSDLAVVVRDCAERVGLRAETGECEELEEGAEYELTLRVRARVVSVHHGHGKAYQLELERRDYYDGQRTVSVDHDELALADRIE